MNLINSESKIGEGAEGREAREREGEGERENVFE